MKLLKFPPLKNETLEEYFLWKSESKIETLENTLDKNLNRSKNETFEISTVEKSNS